MSTPPPRPAYAPTPGLVTDPWHIPGQRPPTLPPAFTTPAAIRELPADHHHTIDWPRVRCAARACCRPAVLVGLALAPAWTRFALPLAEQHGAGAVIGLGFMACFWTGVAQATGRVHRALTTAVLVAVGAGTLALTPAALAHYLLES
ncbi:hypothetical protein [Kitasatospora purpeofusca]|uniref:hypothetical protein n=1 Tax=Kitasatospora purpeofusca TaxID=67352 RepID=UPI002252C80D|nr:hypothetical protein [Kitasatospora purpeofusca]MCX4752912.1 hypothetical protein [Kitasatospora purpeofusca]WSR32455.1 hypothetical protein OG715_16565 [Kitasatospora purpeofusca]WSR40543.1 hypothetical protein OG196_16350 [Kitasatospora purpeofusca]